MLNFGHAYSQWTMLSLTVKRRLNTSLELFCAQHFARTRQWWARSQEQLSPFASRICAVLSFFFHPWQEVLWEKHVIAPKVQISFGHGRSWHPEVTSQADIWLTSSAQITAASKALQDWPRNFLSVQGEVGWSKYWWHGDAVERL